VGGLKTGKCLVLMSYRTEEEEGTQIVLQVTRCATTQLQEAKQHSDGLGRASLPRLRIRSRGQQP